MSPKDKAIELFNKYDECLNNIAIGSNGIEHHLSERAKWCAYILAEEIINGNFGDGYDYQFWENVKAEILTL